MASETQPPNPAQVAAPPQSHDAAQREFQLTLSGFSAIDKPEYEDYSRCVHCGLCANNCPTYRLWGREADSPRGRIKQMALVDQGRLELGESFVLHIDRCLNCRNCETVCPSGVEYGKILELARAQIEQKYKRPLASRLARDFVYRRLLPYPRRIVAVARALKIYQRSGLAAFARATGILRLLGLQDREKLLPRIDSDFFFSELGKTFPAQGPRRARRRRGALSPPARPPPAPHTFPAHAPAPVAAAIAASISGVEMPAINALRFCHSRSSAAPAARKSPAVSAFSMSVALCAIEP